MKTIHLILGVCLACAALWLAGCGGAPSTPLDQAAQNGEVAVIQKHIDAGTDVNAADADGRSPLHWAALNGHPDAAMLLLKSGADITLRDSNGKTPIDLARQGGHADLAKTLQEGPQSSGRQLIDGGLGVSGAMDIDL